MQRTEVPLLLPQRPRPWARGVAGREARQASSQTRVLHATSMSTNGIRPPGVNAADTSGTVLGVFLAARQAVLCRDLGQAPVRHQGVEALEAADATAGRQAYRNSPVESQKSVIRESYQGITNYLLYVICREAQCKSCNNLRKKRLAVPWKKISTRRFRLDNMTDCTRCA